MKKWMLWGIFMLLLPWLLALICMKGTGQAVWGSENRERRGYFAFSG